jgi:hypothetical protein
VPPRDAGYRVIAVNLHAAGIAEADRVARILRDEGWPRATRSLVVREALDRLLEELRDKSPEETFRVFVDRRARRTGGSRRSPSRDRQGPE